MRISLFSYFVFSILFISCTQTKKEILNEENKFLLRVLCDENDSLVFDSQLKVFLNKFSQYKAKATFGGPELILKYLATDSVNAVLTHQPLSKEQKASFLEAKLEPNCILLAYDAVAFVVNKNAPDSVFTVQQIKEILTGRITTWNQLNANYPKFKIQMVFDKAGSANYFYLRDSICNGADISKNVSATNSNRQVISYAGTNQYAIGIVGCNWVMDTYDPLSDELKKEVNVVAIEHKNFKAKPTINNIKSAKYPFYRPLYAIARNQMADGGTAFVNYLSSEHGQWVFYQSGIFPVYKNFNTRTINIVK